MYGPKLQNYLRTGRQVITITGLQSLLEDLKLAVKIKGKTKNQLK
tara:strand:+ start:144 stop:278 length:135 start_codon:yes stop_codon:yes gene_type:complete